MSTEPFRARAKPGGDSPWQVLASGEATGGLLIVGEARMPARTPGPSLHVHTREDEAVYVVEGVLTVVVGDDRFEATPGELVWLPRDVPHTFANLSDAPVWTVGATVPAGIEGMFAEQAEYFASLDGPPDPARIAEIGGCYGVSVVGPPLEIPGESRP